jgi:hypothetical protein
VVEVKREKEEVVAAESLTFLVICPDKIYLRSSIIN